MQCNEIIAQKRKKKKTSDVIIRHFTVKVRQFHCEKLEIKFLLYNKYDKFPF